VPIAMRLILGLLLVMCAAVASATVRTVHIKGTVANIQSWEIKGYYTTMVVSSMPAPKPGVVSTRPQLVVDAKSGRFEGDIECAVVRNANGRWVDVHLVNMAVTYQVNTEMVIRAPYSTSIDLGTFDWKPSRYRMKSGALVIDTSVPRDTVVGDLFSNHVHISPINPEPGDSIKFEFVWGSSGEPHQAGFGGFYMKDCCTILCDLTFAVRTDTDTYTESWNRHVTLHLQPDAEGRYRLRQAPAQGEHLRDVDFLLGDDLYFNVCERSDP
ncbi:MAG TPA: hypothetical protein PLB89_18130, partial [Flavobacteriales bacterium]|nr:hypothetical protein [Flavobacteriales bacterium]